MKTIIIMYMPGHAGNFLSRLFSLGEETIPQVPLGVLSGHIQVELPHCADDRLPVYSFKQVNSMYSSWQNFHRQWPDFKNHADFELLNLLNNAKYSTVVHAIHPAEFFYHERDFSVLEEVSFWCVELSLEIHGAWVGRYQKQLGFVNRPGEDRLFDRYKNKYQMNTINLNLFLTSTESFLQEYTRLASAMGITLMPAQATKLYHDWISVRG